MDSFHFEIKIVPAKFHVRRYTPDQFKSRSLQRREHGKHLALLTLHFTLILDALWLVIGVERIRPWCVMSFLFHLELNQLSLQMNVFTLLGQRAGALSSYYNTSLYRNLPLFPSTFPSN